MLAFISRQEAADQRDKAERSAEVSESLALVANAQKELEKHNNELAIALALEANTDPRSRRVKPFKFWPTRPFRRARCACSRVTPTR